MSSLSNNMYRVGEYVYFDSKGNHPYLIRRIEEFLKGSNGTMDVRTTVCYRRRDVSAAILRVADGAYREYPEYLEMGEDGQIRKKDRKPKTEEGPEEESTGEESPLEEEDALMEEIVIEAPVDPDEKDVTPVEKEASPVEMETTPVKENGAEEKEEPREEQEDEEPFLDLPQAEIKEESVEAEEKASEDAGDGTVPDVKPEAGPAEPTEKKKIERFDWGLGGLPKDAKEITADERFRIRQREIFLSRKEEKLSVNHIRGKVQVNLLCDIEVSADYLYKEDAYFYSLVYDPEKLSMLADKGAIRVGRQYQVDPAVIPECCVEQTDVVKENGDRDVEMKVEDDDNDENKENGDLVIAEEVEIKEAVPTTPTTEDDSDDYTDRFVLVYKPNPNISNHDIDRYLVHVRAIGVFARLLDPNSASRYPSAQMLAALAAKDSTTQYAMCLLHKAGYNIAKACDYLIPPADKDRFPLSIDDDLTFNTISLGGPLLVRDQLEEFSAAEGALFEEGLERMGKDFSEIRVQMMPWRTLAAIVDYYYLYKTTNRYIDGRKKKLAAEKESKLQQVYVPPASKDEFHLITSGDNSSPAPTTPECLDCQGCQTENSEKWYKWGSRQNNYRLCQECWIFWRKNGGLQKPHHDDRFDTENPANPDAAEQLIRTLSNAQLTKALTRDPKRCGVLTSYVVASPSDLKSFQGLQGKNRANFNMKTNLFTRAVRRVLTKQVLPLRKYARTPSIEINTALLKPHVAAADQSKMCEAIKALVGKASEAAATQYQPMVTMMVTQFLGCGKRPRPPTPSEEPVAKRAPALSTLPCIADDAPSSPRSDHFCFFSGPKFRQRRRELIELLLARRISRRPHRFDDAVLGAPLAFLADFVKSQSHNLLSDEYVS